MAITERVTGTLDPIEPLTISRTTRLVLRHYPSHQNAGYQTAKRAMDIVGGLLLLLLALPFLLVIPILIKMTSRGPVLFRQKRIGLGGTEFWCYKFRTMVVDAEGLLKQSPQLLAQFQENYKLKCDPRVTRLGAALRKTSLDELPQIFNVLAGEMSLIGPRPIVPPELSKYGDQAEKLVTVKPGLSGPWQAGGRSDTNYTERVAMDMEYIDHASLSLDLTLIGKTAVAVFKRHGAC